MNRGHGNGYVTHECAIGALFSVNARAYIYIYIYIYISYMYIYMHCTLRSAPVVCWLRIARPCIPFNMRYGNNSLRWRHNERNGVSNHQPHDYLLNRLFRRRSKKTSKVCVTGFCDENSPVAGEFPAQRDSYAENVSIWWRYHVAYYTCTYIRRTYQPSMFISAIFLCVWKRYIKYPQKHINLAFVKQIKTNNPSFFRYVCDCLIT